MKSVPTIDAHHHIWRLNDLPWLSGPQGPPIFGPYQPICRDYPVSEYRSDTAGCDIVKSIYIQTNWPAGKSFDEARWVPTKPAGRTPTSRMRTSPIPMQVRY